MRFFEVSNFVNDMLAAELKNTVSRNEVIVADCVKVSNLEFKIDEGPVCKYVNVKDWRKGVLL